jgi:adenylate cyclase
MPHVFISYASASRRQAEQVSDALRAGGFTVWRDDELPPHRPYAEVIEERLRSAAAVVVMWSDDAAKSQWVRAEADLALTESKLVQVAVDGALPPMPFNQVQCANLRNWDGDVANSEWLKVTKAVGELVQLEPAAPSAPRAPVSVGPLLAVLPFDNLSGDPDMVYFSDGVSEEILQTIAQTTDLKVIGRSSSFHFRGPDKAVRKVAAELKSTHVLDGSVRRAGQHVRISAQLIDCATQTNVWSARFDRELSDIFLLQDEIAALIADALKAAFAPSANTGSIDPAAYDLYLRARAHSPGREGHFNVALLRQAVARAPNFSQAWAVLAYTVASEARYATGDLVVRLHAEAREAAAKALALDPSAGLAHAALGFLHAPCGEYAEWEASLARALEVSPRDPIVLYQCSLARCWVGRIREAFEFIDSVNELDPLYAQGANWRAMVLEANGRSAHAAAAYRAARDRWPEFEFLFVNATKFACRAGDWDWVDEMAGEMKRLGVDTPLVRYAAWMVGVRRASPQDAAAMLRADLEQQLAETGSITLSALALAAELGALDDAYELAQRASFEHLFRPGAHLPSRNISVQTLFMWDGERLRRDRRFVGLCHRLGLIDHWSATGHWPDCVAEVAPLYDFRAECAALVGESRPAPAD